MPEGTTIAQRLQEEGIQKVDAFLTSVCSAHRLPTQDVQAVTRETMIAGWELEIQCDAGVRRLHIVLDENFPFSIPYFFLVDRPPYLTWPHIEKDGFLCLITGSKASQPRRPAEMVGELFADAFDLVRDSETGANVSDFQSGFETYWARSIEHKALEVLSLLELDGRSRIVQVWRGDIKPVVGDSEAQILAWQRKRHGDKPQFNATDDALLLWLEEPLLPSQYPAWAADVYRLAQKSKSNRALIERFARTTKTPAYFILAANTQNGPCLAAVRGSRPVTIDIRGRRRDRLQNGFRPGKVPQSLVAQRLFSTSAKAERIRVQRVDSDWIHGRGRDVRHREIRGKKVILAGCGSVGGPVAVQLAMAGVGSIRIIDPETLSWANVGRHPLGADRVGSSKAIELAKDLQQRFPHADVHGVCSTYDAFSSGHPNLVQEADLIISATAEWESENLMNLQKINGEITAPILYTWTEPNACAGHGVVIQNGPPCLQCGMTLKGAIRAPITVWTNEEESLSEPACGGVFHPYGPVELQGTISAAASLALDTLLGKVNGATHRVWAGPKALLVENGGDWSETWRDGHPEREMGALQTDLPWQQDRLCPACSGSVTGAHSSSESGTPNNALSSPLQCSII